MCNLQTWAQMDLRWQNIQTLAQAITAADQLLDYKSDPAKGYGGVKNESVDKRKAL